jgi:hypothetical protein
MSLIYDVNSLRQQILTFAPELTIPDWVLWPLATHPAMQNRKLFLCKANANVWHKNACKGSDCCDAPTDFSQECLLSRVNAWERSMDQGTSPKNSPPTAAASISPSTPL